MQNKLAQSHIGVNNKIQKEPEQKKVIQNISN